MSEVKRLVSVCGATAGLLFGAVSTFDLGWRKGVPVGMAAGIAFGSAVFAFEVLWGLGATLTTLARSRQLRAHPSFVGETLKRRDEACHVVGIIAVRGWLYLTNRALYFRSHPRDPLRHEWDVALAQLRRAEATRTLGFIPSGLRIVTTRETERFVIKNNKGWVGAISSAKEAAAQQGDEADER